MTLLGIDIGSSGVKGARVDLADGSITSAQAGVQLHSPHPGWAEADPGQWWAGVCAVTRELVSEGAPVEAVACSGMVPAVLALDEHGRPLRRAILQNDARADAEVEELADELSDLDLVALTGSALTQQSVAPTVRWLRRHEPDLFDATASLAGSYDWIAMELGARPHVERNWALESGLFGLDGRPLREVMARSEVGPALLPDVAAPGEVVGEVSAGAAADTGLRAGTPIVVGGADHVSSAYGAGLVGDGDWLVKLGGAGDILAVSEAPLLDGRLYLDAHPAGGWLPNGCMATSGSLVRWLAAVCGGVDLETLDAEAAEIPPGAGGVVCLPYFLGEKSPLHDPRQRGAFVGLHLGHTRGHLYRAALEAVAFGFRHHVEVFHELGVSLSAARVTNGGSRSTLWKQILADVLGTPLSPVLDHPGASFGAALAAGVGVGSAPGWSVVSELARLGSPIEPRTAYRERYDELYGVYRALEPVLRPISHRLAAGDWSER
ncbi:MAG TPA: FGGY family carbohydrate kinase [Solirubrobacteraceae bacterium]|jgi:xylulokinase